ncbi:MAG: hypothetical protein R3234_01800 [Thermoanaerobaculia bacterium]|nr:hypothetical protein [Thermoanaerobaculia bacterium]
MSEKTIAQLEALELDLLQRRTEIRKRQQELLTDGGWDAEKAERLSEDYDRVQSELTDVRRRLMEKR